jgi:hypothetical protein
VHYSGNVSYSYPASQNGGSGTAYYSGTAYEDVNVNINVDTDPFDRSVSGCNTSVNTLTGAVIATEAAQIASIDKNAKKVAGTIIEGFFKNIRFEISGQITELTQKIDSYLMHLRESAKQLSKRKVQMESDYNHTASRYGKIFDNLNKELANRIFELDKPAFSFKRNCDIHAQRATNNDLVNVVAIAGAEGSDLQARISASITKKRALNAINQANIFLLKQKRLQRTINRSMLNETTVGLRFSPVCFLETNNNNGQIGKMVYQPDYLPQIQANSIINGFQTRQWDAIPKDSQEKIRRYFNTELSNAYSGADTQSIRVKDAIIRMFDFNSIKIAGK